MDTIFPGDEDVRKPKKSLTLSSIRLCVQSLTLQKVCMHRVSVSQILDFLTMMNIERGNIIICGNKTSYNNIISNVQIQN